MLPLAKVSACHHRVATSLFFFCGETFDHQREKAGEDGRGGECARTSFPPACLGQRLPRRQNFIDNPARYKGLFALFLTPRPPSLPLNNLFIIYI